MRKSLTVIAALCTCLQAHAQNISVSQFRAAPDDFSAAASQTRRIDLSGDACALVKIATKQSGFSFDAGMECIADVVYADPGIWLYLPGGTRSITVSHKLFGTLSGWQFPITLEPARTYEMTLRTEMPKAARPEREKKPRPEFNVDGFSSHFLQSFIGMEICEGSVYGAVAGLNYTFNPGRTGFYVSLGYGFESESLNLFAGPSLRMLDSSSYTDWQLYAGAGYADGGLGLEVGSKIGWNNDNVLSRWDFSIGCQYLGSSTFVPYLGLGAGVTSYSLLGMLALFICILGEAL